MCLESERWKWLIRRILFWIVTCFIEYMYYVYIFAGFGFPIYFLSIIALLLRAELTLCFNINEIKHWVDIGISSPTSIYRYITANIPQRYDHILGTWKCNSQSKNIFENQNSLQYCFTVKWKNIYIYKCGLWNICLFVSVTQLSTRVFIH